MKVKKYLCAALLMAMALSTAAQADVVGFGPPPRNPQSEIFVELYKEGITTWDQVKDGDFKEGKSIVFWRYPNSGQVEGIIRLHGYERSSQSRSDPDVIERANDQYLDNTEELPYPGYVPYDPCYVDSAGRAWGYRSYFDGHRMVWVCLSDPANEKLPADPDVVSAVNKGVSSMLWRECAPATIMVVAVVAVTVALICRFWCKKKKRG